ncbi:PBS lyase HEAT-like repeat protein [Halobacteroides halobius DSM 5150]|uniref:PBS lyase HEAT-like repeat protein n=1 Tax=Halobacteroides halobius (strain ATCC 35273 / DSM 5150 / MD-1) TaxID=748449 RepID=L0K9P0_HALHC|nr:HEAT repeat domain-containing protein [Halobacteroides halobius]AGB41089.1 PBS lyase HEAT-like repeat protein [Halobacteroides halobius DSM 5150]
MLLSLLFKKEEEEVEYDTLISKLRSNLKQGLSLVDQLEDIHIKQRLLLEGKKDLEKKIYLKVKKAIIEGDFFKQLLAKSINSECEVKKQAISILMEHKTPQTVDYLIPFLYDDNLEIKNLVIEELAKVNNTKAVTTLVNYLDYCNEVATQQTLRQAFYNLGSKCVPKLLELIDSETKHLNWIVKLLGEIGDEEIIDPLLELLEKHSKPEIRVGATKSLSQFLDYPRVFNSLLVALEDQDCHVRAQIVKLLSKIDNSEILSYIYYMLDDTSGIVRSNAARALLESGNEGIKYLILGAEKKESPEVLRCLKEVDTLKLIKIIKEDYQTDDFNENSAVLRVIDDSDDEKLTG